MRWEEKNENIRFVSPESVLIHNYMREQCDYSVFYCKNGTPKMPF